MSIEAVLLLIIKKIHHTYLSMEEVLLRVKKKILHTHLSTGKKKEKKKALSGTIKKIHHTYLSLNSPLRDDPGHAAVAGITNMCFVWMARTGHSCRVHVFFTSDSSFAGRSKTLGRGQTRLFDAGFYMLSVASFWISPESALMTNMRV